ncbi:MAG: vWA domain-containing protein [Chlorobiaceae bacterium]
MMPMYQAEAMWICFRSDDVDDRAAYPFAIKIATGKVNAVSGQAMNKGLNMEPQDYVVAPKQPWLDGYCVEKGVIRQFVAMPLGQGYSAEEQVTGKGEFGGLQILVYPMKRAAFERRFQKRRPASAYSIDCDPSSASAQSMPDYFPSCVPCIPSYIRRSMGLAPGGRMRQEIYDDSFELEDWDLENYSHCFVHIANSEVWSTITGRTPPHRPLTAASYSSSGFPWFDYYAESGTTAIDGSEKLKGLKSVNEMGEKKNESPLPENDPVEDLQVQALGKGPRIVREGGLESKTPGGERVTAKQTGEKKMKKGYTHITVILDRSGSMESIREDTVGGLNAFVEGQKRVAGEATYTLVQFDSQDPYEVIRHFSPIETVSALSKETYVPRGGTPLLDALGRGINDIEKSISKLKDEEQPENVIVAVITDGEENSSREFNKKQIEQMIKDKSSEAGWEFIFLSSDLSAIEDARRLGFKRESTVAFEKSPAGVACCMASMSDRVSACRTVEKGKVP